MILYLNELSVPENSSDIEALDLAKTLIHVLVEINQVESISITADATINNFSLCRSRNLTFGSIFSHDDYREEWRKLKSFFDRAPFDSLEQTDYEYRYGHRIAVGLGFAHRNKTLAVSLATNGWLEHSLIVTLFCFDLVLNEFTEIDVQVKNIANNDNLAHWKNWIVGELPDLPGFPEASRSKPKTPTDCGLRSRWRLPTGEILEWDYLHCEIEKYDSKGKHLGAFDPNTGLAIAGKVADANRRIEP
jgi:hypothetical protein